MSPTWGGRPGEQPRPRLADQNRAQWRLAAGRNLGLAAGLGGAEAEGLGDGYEGYGYDAPH